MTDEELMRAALDEAKIAADLGEVPVGAVVAKDGEIVARAHNLRESGKNATYHAELMAIDAACKALGGWRLWQCELFVTLEPCPMCSGAIINSRFKAGRLRRTRPQGGLLRQPDRSVRPAVQPPSCHRIGPAGGRGAGPAAGFFCDAAGKTKEKAVMRRGGFHIRQRRGRDPSLQSDFKGGAVGANMVRPCPFAAAASFPGGYRIRPYGLNTGRVLP